MQMALRLAALKPDGAAARAGLREGDLLLGADGRAWRDSGDMLAAIDAATTRNRPSTWRVHRDGEHLSFDLPPGALGITAEPTPVEGLDALRERAGLALHAPTAPAAAVTAPSGEGAVLQVHVVDFDMPFINMVVFMVKWAIAAIPALIILAILCALVAGILGGMFRVGLMR